MFNCPHCLLPLVGGKFEKRASDTAEARIFCTHCEAILRIEITTLREPNQEKLKKGKEK